MNRSALFDQITQARREVRRMKKHTPYIFQEWQDLRNDEDAWERAKSNLARARAAWANLGKDPQ